MIQIIYLIIKILLIRVIDHHQFLWNFATKVLDIFVITEFWLFFPFSNFDRTTYACIIHSNASSNMILDMKKHEISHLNNVSMHPHFSVATLHFQSNLYFCSTFLLMVYMYIAHSSLEVTVLREKMSKLQQETDVDNKSKIQLSSILSHKYTEQDFIHIPEWLHQIADTKTFIL